MNYQYYTHQSSITYNCHCELIDSPILVSYDDTHIPQLVPPLEEDRIPQLVSPFEEDRVPTFISQSVRPSYAYRYTREPFPQPRFNIRPQTPPPHGYRTLYTTPPHVPHRNPSSSPNRPIRSSSPVIEIIEIPIEVPVDLPAEVYVPIPTEMPEQQQQQVPQHVINGYIESLVQKKELCPILMTELTLTTTSMTPCGHCISKDALTTWFETTHACPVCRLPCSAHQLQSWKL